MPGWNSSLTVAISNNFQPLGSTGRLGIWFNLIWQQNGSVLPSSPLPRAFWLRRVLINGGGYISPDRLVLTNVGDNVSVFFFEPNISDPVIGRLAVNYQVRAADGMTDYDLVYRFLNSWDYT